MTAVVASNLQENRLTEGECMQQQMVYSECDSLGILYSFVYLTCPLCLLRLEDYSPAMHLRGFLLLV